MTTRTWLDVDADTVDLARRFGARLDKRTNTWFAAGEVPPELLNLVRRGPPPPVLKSRGPIQVLEALTTRTCRPSATSSLGPEQIELWTLAIEQHRYQVERAARWFVTIKTELKLSTPAKAMSSVAGRSIVERLLRELWV
jgi:hypothetical protein